MKNNHIEIILKQISLDNFGEDEVNKYLWDNYHFEISFGEDTEIPDGVFYNQDLRSFMGYYIDEAGSGSLRLYIFPEYYKLGWEDTYWKKLMEDCEIIEE